MNSKIQLINKLTREIEDLENQKKINDDIKDFIDEFYKKNKNLKPSELDSVNIFDFTVLHFLKERNDLTFEDCMELLEPLQEVINKISMPLTIQEFFLSCSTVIILSDADLLKELIKSNDCIKILNDKIIKKRRKLDFRIIDNIFSINKIITEHNLNRTEVSKIVDLLNKYDYEITFFINAICISKFVNLIKLKTKITSIFNKKRNEKLDEDIKIKANTDYFYEKLEKIWDFKEEFKKKDNIRIAKIQKKQDDLKEVIDTLETAQEEIINYRSLLEKINEKFRLEALKVIYEHNENIYKNISKEHFDLLEDNEIKYQNLLTKYGLKQGSYAVEKLVKINYTELENSLDILSKFDFSDQTLLYIIENSKCEEIKKINSYFDRGILNKKFIRHNYLIFINNSKENINLNKNIELLEQENINPNNFALSAKILLIDSKLFFKNIMILKEYSLLTSIKTTASYNFLQDENLILKIDKLIELGMEKFLEENLGLLNSKNIDRLYILRELNIPIEDIGQLVEFLKLKKFYVSDEKIFDYIFTKKSFSNDLEEDSIIDLDKYTKTSRTLDINGVLFSKNKVKRKLKSNNYNDVRCALFSDIYLSNDEYELVEAALDNDKVYTYKI